MTATTNLFYRAICSKNSEALFHLTQKFDHARALFGTGYHENNTMATALANDKDDYPLAQLIYSKESREVIGAVVVQTVSKDSVEVCIFADTVETFMEVLIKVRKELPGKTFYVSPHNKAVSAALNFFSAVRIDVESVRNPEFKLSF